MHTNSECSSNRSSQSSLLLNQVFRGTHLHSMSIVAVIAVCHCQVDWSKFKMEDDEEDEEEEEEEEEESD